MKSSLGHLDQVVKTFLQKYWDNVSPILIAYSGGPDSKALLYACHQWVKSSLHIAHVDHGWRKESKEEATLLQKEAQELGIPFHAIRLDRLTTEEEARTLRLQFFASLKDKISYQAVLLGHQADDLAETVLKRVFEGAHLSHLGGMRATTLVNDVLLWRPLLTITRREIEQYLFDRKFVALSDPSNQDSHYLRARIRSEILPFLNRTFGKNISENLAVLSERSLELDDYLQKRSKDFTNYIAKGPFGWWIDGHHLHRIELRYLIQSAADQENIMLTRPVLETIMEWMERKSTHHQIQINQRTLRVDRGHFFILAKKMPQFAEPISLMGEGIQARSGDWVIEEVAVKTQFGPKSALALPDSIFPEASFATTSKGSTATSVQCDWKSLWRGECSFQSFDEKMTLQLPPPRLHWNDKVPSFFRKICPILLRDNEKMGDFISGKIISGQRKMKIFVCSEQANGQGDK